MPRVRVIADDGWIALDEHVGPAQMESRHYRDCLVDRTRWVVDDAAQHAAPGLSLVERPPEDAALQAA